MFPRSNKEVNEMGILLIEDDEVTGTLCKTVISQFAPVWWAKSIADALAIIKAQKVELMIVDILLPDGNGIEFYQKVQSEILSPPPAVFLTQQNEVPTKVVAFSMGAIDYISKPFDAIEFQARIRSHWSRTGYKQRFFEWGRYKLDQESMKVFITADSGEHEIDCTSYEFKILVLLLKSPEKIFSREEIIDRIWGGGHHVTERNIDSHVARLRKKLTQYGGLIESVRGCGYRIRESQTRAG